MSSVWARAAYYQSGILFDELLEHMRDAAKAIDFLNEPRHQIGDELVSIIHRDIKPQNLLLIGGGVKVADFGLAQVINRSVKSATGGMTPAYSAPEFFQGQSTRYSDQYSLAIAYYQLRTGNLPFLGNAFEVMLGHIKKQPDLSGLPEREQAVLMRALAKEPHERWPTCLGFVRGLEESNFTTLIDKSRIAKQLTVDTSPLMGSSGRIHTFPYDPKRPVYDFLTAVFALVSLEVEAYSYGKKWVLRDASTFRIFDVGSSWARSNQLTQDNRCLDQVGITDVTHLEVVPLFNNSPKSDHRPDQRAQVPIAGPWWWPFW